MRIDLYLKQSRLIKRRKIAHEAVKNELVLINGSTVKPSYKVKINDEIKLTLGLKEINLLVTSLKPHKEKLMYKLISEEFKGQRK